MQKPNDSNRQRFASVWDAIEETPQQAVGNMTATAGMAASGLSRLEQRA